MLLRSFWFVLLISGCASNAVDSTGDTEGGADAHGIVPTATITPVVDLGLVRLEEVGRREVFVTNAGILPVHIDAFRLSGHPDFRLWLPGAPEGSAPYEPEGVEVALPARIELGQGDDVAFVVGFTPEGPDPATAELEVVTTAGVLRAELKANVNRPCIRVEPSLLQFGPALYGQTKTLDVTVTSCGTVPLEITAVGIRDDASGSFTLGGPALPDGSGEPAPVALAPGASQFMPVRYSPILTPQDGGPQSHAAELFVASNAFEPEVTVEMQGYGGSELCPVAVGTIQEGEEVIPQTNLHLNSDSSYAFHGGISKRKWSVVQPTGSQSVFVPADTFPNPTFEANVAGTYTFRLDVWDEQDTKSCVPWEAAVHVVPDEAIHIELVWHNPDDVDETDEGAETGADLDLHFAHALADGGADLDGDGQPDPWFGETYDCFWWSPQPEWGAPDPANDDPGLDRDDTDGAGPENLNLNVAEDGMTYRIGVHYWADHGFGQAIATVRVYIYQNLVAEWSEMPLVEGDFWWVATLSWPDAKLAVDLGEGDGYRITPGYVNPTFLKELE